MEISMLPEHKGDDLLELCFYPEDEVFLAELRAMDGVTILELDASDEWLWLVRLRCADEAVRASLIEGCY